jgi:hypothetical protein
MIGRAARISGVGRVRCRAAAKLKCYKSVSSVSWLARSCCLSLSLRLSVPMCTQRVAVQFQGAASESEGSINLCIYIDILSPSVWLAVAVAAYVLCLCLRSCLAVGCGSVAAGAGVLLVWGWGRQPS